MILDRDKTFELIFAAAIESGESYSITADNLDEIALCFTNDNTIVFENDSGTEIEEEYLSDDEIKAFCWEYNVKPVYDIEESIAEIRGYLLSLLPGCEETNVEELYKLIKNK